MIQRHRAHPVPGDGHRRGGLARWSSATTTSSRSPATRRDGITGGNIDWARRRRGPTLSPRRDLPGGAHARRDHGALQPPARLPGRLQLPEGGHRHAGHPRWTRRPSAWPRRPTPRASDTKLVSTDFNALEVLNPGEDQLRRHLERRATAASTTGSPCSRAASWSPAPASPTRTTRSLATGWRTWVKLGVDTPAQFNRRRSRRTGSTRSARWSRTARSSPSRPTGSTPAARRPRRRCASATPSARPSTQRVGRAGRGAGARVPRRDPRRALPAPPGGRPVLPHRPDERARADHPRRLQRADEPQLAGLEHRGEPGGLAHAGRSRAGRDRAVHHLQALPQDRSASRLPAAHHRQLAGGLRVRLEEPGAAALPLPRPLRRACRRPRPSRSPTRSSSTPTATGTTPALLDHRARARAVCHWRRSRPRPCPPTRRAWPNAGARSSTRTEERGENLPCFRLGRCAIPRRVFEAIFNPYVCDSRGGDGR